MKLIAKRTASLLAATSLALFFSTSASAWTVCGQGQIKAIDYVWGDEGSLRIQTEQMPADFTQYLWVKGMGTMIELSPGKVETTSRAPDRARLLEMAVANKLAVQVLSLTESCKGTSDDFDIAICNDAAQCATSR